MQILFVNHEESLRQLFHMAVASEGFTITSTQSAAEAIGILEGSLDESFLLFADNTIFNVEAIRVFAMLRASPEVRRRVRIIGWNVFHDRDYLQERAEGMLDDFLSMPFNADQLLGCIATNADIPTTFLQRLPSSAIRT